uniref:Uncharacterized protein n=1 Tax=Moniliophthora roreri TaxID=221103 RepID=A0A0W0FYN3_MONRR
MFFVFCEHFEVEHFNKREST